LLERIKSEVVVRNKSVTWDDIAGLDEAKTIIFERVIAPISNPEMFATGMASKARAILLFGPPGNGKTMIGKCMASMINATFMSISSSSLTSKWLGESETLVKALFAYARIQERTIIFFDEIDSMLGKRDDSGSSENTIRFKTEFLVQLDGINEISDEDNILLIGATNRPESLDEAMLRRFQARILIPLPDKATRYQLLKNLLTSSKEKHTLTEEDFNLIADKTEGYSGADIHSVASSASFRNVRKYMKSHGMNAPAANVSNLRFKFHTQNLFYFIDSDHHRVLKTI
jgi:fidgetin-like protein 1